MKKQYSKPSFVKSENVDQPHVYCVMNKVNSKVYVGVHNGSDTENYMGSGTLIKQAHEKYGLENFKKVILKTFETIEDAYAYEAEIVNKEFISHKWNYNLIEGGLGGTWTPQAQASGRKSQKELGVGIHNPEVQAMGRAAANEYHKSTGWAAQKENFAKGRKVAKELEKCAFHNKDLQRQSAEKAWAALKADGYSKSEAKKIATCPYCNKSGNAMAMKRWHFDKCRLAPTVQ